MKSVTFIFNKTPYGSHSGRELLDICLMTAAFEMSITVIFQDKGIYQLLDKQQPDVLNIKNHSLTFKALPLYGIEKILVDSMSLANSPYNQEQLLDIAETAEPGAIKQAIADSDFVLML